MIDKFMTVYAGHIDIPDHGQNATPANDRRYNNDQLASVFDKTEAIAKVMDELGYDTLWLAEHHFQHEGYECLPNILMCAVHLAHVTKKLRIGCGFNIAPMWHPLRLAEDYATADILTKGTDRVRRRARLSQPRGRDLRQSDHRPGGQPRTVRGAGRDPLQGVQQRKLLARGQALHTSRAGALSRLRPQGADAGAAPRQPAGRMLAADRQRVEARHRIHGAPRHQGPRRRRRRDHGRGADPGLSAGGERDGPRPQARREFDDRPRLLSGEDQGAGGARAEAALRRARQDVRAPGLCAGADARRRSRRSAGAAAGMRPGCRRSSIT